MHPTTIQGRPGSNNNHPGTTLECFQRPQFYCNLPQCIAIFSGPRGQGDCNPLPPPPRPGHRVPLQPRRLLCRRRPRRHMYSIPKARAIPRAVACFASSPMTNARPMTPPPPHPRWSHPPPPCARAPGGPEAPPHVVSTWYPYKAPSSLGHTGGGAPHVIPGALASRRRPPETNPRPSAGRGRDRRLCTSKHRRPCVSLVTRRA